MTTITTTIRLKRDTSANWINNNPILNNAWTFTNLMQTEFGYQTTASTRGVKQAQGQAKII